jgi:hypothetical protein
VTFGVALIIGLAGLGWFAFDAGVPSVAPAPTDAGVASADAASADAASADVRANAGPEPPHAMRAGKPRPAIDYELRPAQDGTGDLVYEDSVFVARVAAEGAVSFRDKHATFSFWPPFLPVKRATPGVPSLQATLSALARGRKPHAAEGEPDDSYLLIPNVTPYRPDPREGCPSCAFQPLVLPLNLSGRLDLTEELMRFSGSDPHRLEKARFLAETRERRIQMAVAAHAEWVRRATAELPARLDEIACDGRRTRAERHAILRALRDEMNTSPEGRAAVAKITAVLAARFERPDGDAGCAAVRQP